MFRWLHQLAVPELGKLREESRIAKRDAVFYKKWTYALRKEASETAMAKCVKRHNCQHPEESVLHLYGDVHPHICGRGPHRIPTAFESEFYSTRTTVVDYGHNHVHGVELCVQCGAFRVSLRKDQDPSFVPWADGVWQFPSLGRKSEDGRPIGASGWYE